MLGFLVIIINLKHYKHHSYEKSLNLSSNYPDSFSPCDSTEQLVNSGSKLVMSISELSLGTKGALIFFFNTDYQLNFSNHGCYFSYFVELCPRRFKGSLWSNLFSKSWSFGVNLIEKCILLIDLGFYTRLPRTIPCGFSS